MTTLFRLKKSSDQSGNCINDDEQLNKIDIETVHCHKKKEEERRRKKSNIDFKYVIYTAIFIATTIRNNNFGSVFK